MLSNLTQSTLRSASELISFSKFYQLFHLRLQTCNTQSRYVYTMHKVALKSKDKLWIQTSKDTRTGRVGKIVSPNRAISNGNKNTRHCTKPSAMFSACACLLKSLCISLSLSAENSLHWTDRSLQPELLCKPKTSIYSPSLSRLPFSTAPSSLRHGHLNKRPSHRGWSFGFFNLCDCVCWFSLRYLC